jgi:hypothetical protein
LIRIIWNRMKINSIEYVADLQSLVSFMSIYTGLCPVLLHICLSGKKIQALIHMKCKSWLKWYNKIEVVQASVDNWIWQCWQKHSFVNKYEWHYSFLYWIAIQFSWKAWHTPKHAWHLISIAWNFKKKLCLFYSYSCFF